MDSYIEVGVKIGAILLSSDESIANVNFGRDYKVVKIKQDGIPFLDNIIDVRGQLNTDYFLSRIIEKDGYGNIVSFMCLKKEDKFTVPVPQFRAGIRYSDMKKILDRSEYLIKYKDNELKYLNSIISLLQIYKKGNIGLREIFFTFKYGILGSINSENIKVVNADVNTIKQNVFSLSEKDVANCNLFIRNYYGTELALMKDTINEFTFGQKQIDEATGFEQYITALEMILLEKNTNMIKETLSKRVSALLGTCDVEIKNLYKKMRKLYRLRSNSLHKGMSITINELDELEDITRMVIKKYLAVCSNAIANNPSITWDEIKKAELISLKKRVKSLINSGVMPSDQYFKNK